MLVALFLCSACASPPNAHETSREAARVASEVRDWPRAATLWSELWFDPASSDSEAAFETARALAATGDRSSALRVMQSRVARTPGDLEAMEYVGLLERDLGRLEAARVTLERVHAQDPGRRRTSEALADLRHQVGDELGALHAARRGLAADLSDGYDPTIEAQRRVALAAARLGHTAEALAAWSAVFDRGAGGADDAVGAARLVLATAPEEPEAGWQPDPRAARWLSAAIEARPGRSDMLRAAAELAVLSGNTERVAGFARRALETDPGDVESLALLVEALWASGDDEGAERILEHGRRLVLEPEQRVRLEALAARK